MKGLEVGIETLSTWCQQHPESNVASEMEICAMSRMEPSQSSHENIFGCKRSYAASASDWKRNNSSDNYLSPAEANKLASNIDAIILKHFPRHVHELNGLDNFKELTKDIFIPFGAKLVQIVDRCWIRISTELQKKTLNEFIEIRKDSYYDLEKFYTLSTSLQLVKHLIQEQFDNDVKSCKEFILRLCNIVDKIEPEKNTICIEGDSNAGKSMFVNSLANLIWSVGYVESNINRSSNFPFKNLLEKRIGVMGEFTYSKSLFQSLKKLFEGAPFNCAVKHKSCVVLPRTPIIITTNHNFTQLFTDACDRAAILNHVYIYNWKKQEWLKDCYKQIHPLVWMRLVYSHIKNDEFFVEPVDRANLLTLCKNEHVKSDTKLSYEQMLSRFNNFIK